MDSGTSLSRWLARAARPASASLALAVVLCASLAAEAFPTRVHIMLSNKIRAALVDSGDATIQLEGSPYKVKLRQEDADAILDHPLAFRAGAVGPDNLLFPGMTDATHGMKFHPYDQCEVLYQEAFTSEEKAFAMGCYLHGATDAVAHHFVNFFSGETFTLNPVSKGRENSFSNVARHILIEGLILEAALEGEPENFSTGQMLHTMPRGFVLRTYFNEVGPLWQLIGTAQREAFEQETRSQDQDALLVEVVRELNYAAIDHLIMLPVYLQDAERRLEHLENRVRNAISDYQNPATERGALLRVGAGDDGELGTEDDTTGCSVTCPEDYAKYFVYLGLIRPRFDSMGRELPSAYNKLQAELVEDLRGFMPVMMQTIESLSARLNSPLSGGEESQGFDIEANEVRRLLQPLDEWTADTADLDHGAVAYAILPDWILTITQAFDTIGLTIDVPDVLNLLFGPVVEQIIATIEEFIIRGVKLFVEALLDFVLEQKEVILEEYEERLWDSTPPDLDGHALTDFYHSGLFMHSFNFAAATLAEHDLILPEGQGDVGHGPTSFDASYTLDWSQVGLCDYLTEPVFPLGMDARGLLSIGLGGQIHAANLPENTPVECHNGELDAFGTPSATSCAVVELAELIADPSHLGSVSRAFPPQYDPSPPTCRNIIVPGLPEPDCATDDSCNEDECAGDDDCAFGESCVQGECVAEMNPDPNPDPNPTPTPEPENGQEPDGFTGDEGFVAPEGGAEEGCAVAPGAPGAGLALWLLVLGVFVMRRRRAALVAVSAAVALSACGDPQADPGPVGPGGFTEDTGDMPDVGGMPDAAPDMMMEDTGMMPDIDMVEDVMTEDVMDMDPDPPPNLARELREKLYGSVWHGEHARDEDGRVFDRGFEVRFDTSSLWAEIKNPFGPARQRVLRSFIIQDDGATVESVVQFPEGWERPPNPGAMETWTVVVEEGNPRRLRLTGQTGTEVFDEGPWPEPDEGLTAQARTFGTGIIEDAFCTSGVGGIDHSVFWEFARGQSPTMPRGYDVVAGARFLPWSDPTDENRFAVTDVDGFERLGGTALSDQRNFVVLYTGVIDHPGGEIAFRELDDSVEDAIWVFLDDKVGSNLEVDMFLEVHGFIWPDGTDDEPVAEFPAGLIDIEVIVPRCSKQIADVDVEMSIGGGEWMPISEAPLVPEIREVYFPAAL